MDSMYLNYLSSWVISVIYHLQNKYEELSQWDKDVELKKESEEQAEDAEPKNGIERLEGELFLGFFGSLLNHLWIMNFIFLFLI